MMIWPIDCYTYSVHSSGGPDPDPTPLSLVASTLWGYISDQPSCTFASGEEGHRTSTHTQHGYDYTDEELDILES